MPITMICSDRHLRYWLFRLLGFVTKSMISYAAADEHLFTWLGLVAAPAGVFLHAGIKTCFVFFRGFCLRPPDPPGNMRLDVYFVCIVHFIGIFQAQYIQFAHEDYEPYTVAHVLFQLQLLLFAGLLSS